MMGSNELSFLSFAFLLDLFLKSFFIIFLNVLFLAYSDLRSLPISFGDLLACSSIDAVNCSSKFGIWELKHWFLCYSINFNLILRVFMHSVQEKRFVILE